MDDTTLADLKQFITATVSQQMAGLASKDDIAGLATKGDITRIEDRLARVETKIDEIQNDINETVVGYVTSVDDQVQDHEKRLTKLEHNAV